VQISPCFSLFPSLSFVSFCYLLYLSLSFSPSLSISLYLSLSISPPPPLSPRGMDLFGGCIRRDSDHQCTESTTITSASLRLLASTGPATQSQTTSRLLGLARCCDPPRRGPGPRRPCSFAQLASSRLMPLEFTCPPSTDAPRGYFCLAARLPASDRHSLLLSVREQRNRRVSACAHTLTVTNSSLAHTDTYASTYYHDPCSPYTSSMISAALGDLLHVHVRARAVSPGAGGRMQ
jgi:hypothetical protein